EHVGLFRRDDVASRERSVGCHSVMCTKNARELMNDRRELMLGLRLGSPERRCGRARGSKREQVESIAKYSADDDF
ncbi:hypothetical protein KC218_28030, partial [Mycobacterium tuberculosis]|nr:hypothetical protein [Mycobacterium tuberculosis]